MMQSPKNRKGKKLAYSAPVAAIFLIVAVFGMQFGCTDTTSGPSEAVQSGITKDVYGAISGVVHDLYTHQPLRGVKVTLQGIKKKYTATSDVNGNFRVNNVYLGTVTGLSGGAGDVLGGSSDPQEVQFEFPLFFNTNSYAPWKEHVVLSYEYIVDNGTIVIPSGTFFEVGRTGLMPFVQSFSGKVWAGTEPAKGVTVMLDHTEWPYDVSDWPECDEGCEDSDDYVELTNSFAVTDEEGIFTFDLADKVVAYGDYQIVVTPYDVPLLPGCQLAPCRPSDETCVQCEGDGLYEYDSTEQWIDLEPKSYYSYNHYDLTGYQLDANGNPIVVQTAEYAINLKDAENDIEVIYCSLEGAGNSLLPENYNNFKINVTFNRPLKAWSFQLLKDQSTPVAIKVEPTSGANISFDITPIQSLNVQGNTWRFRILRVVDYMGDDDLLYCYDTGGGSSCSWDFNVAGGVPAVGPIPPYVNVNVYSDQDFQMTVPDRRAIYRLYKSFGPTNPNSVLSVMENGADILPLIHLAFAKPATTVGYDGSYSYYVFVSDTKANTAWVQLGLEDTYDDGQSVEGYIYLPSNFRYSSGGDNNYLGDGNQLRLTVLPVNEDGSIDASQLETIAAGNVTTLQDSWGPMIVGQNVTIYGSNGTYSADGGTLYDETANIAFSEILNASVAPSATTSSANFDVTGVYMDEKHTFVTTEFQPAVTAQILAGVKNTNILVVSDVSGFYQGDLVNLYLTSALSVKTEGRNALGGDIRVIGFDETTNILILSRNLSVNHSAGEVVAMVGPMQAGVTAWTNRLNQSTQESARYIAVAPDAAGNLPASGSLLIVNGQEIVPVSSGYNLPIMIGSPLSAAYIAGTSAQSASAGYGDTDGDCCDADDADTVARTVLLEDAAGGATSITVEDASDIAVGDWLVVGSDDYVRVASITPGSGDEATLTFEAGQMLHYTYPARLTAVVELTIVTDSTTLLAYPMIDVYYDIDDLLPGAAISIVDPNVPENVYSSTVLSTYASAGDNNWIGLADLAPVVCEGTCEVSNFPYWSLVTADSTRTPDSVQVIVTDTSGNTSAATDKDGDGQADFDELELWSGGSVK